MGKTRAGVAVAMGLTAGALWLAPAAGAAPFTVNLTSDSADANTADAACDVDLATDGPQCTLRAAIQQANALAGADTIGFSLVSGNTIAPGSALPTISQQVTIDGTTQPLDGRVELDGSSAGTSASGLTLNAGSSNISGLVINRFALNGINVAGDDNTISGNRIGTSQDGTVAHGNGASGIQVSSGARNTISGNLVSANSSGIIVSGADDGSISANTVGTNAAGTAALGNSPGRGIQLNSGSTGNAVTGNLVSGNGGAGLTIAAGATGTGVRGNVIGLDSAGTGDLGNGTGVSVGASSTTIGGTSADDRNVISGSASFGIDIDGSPSGVTIEGNRIGTNRAGTGAVANGDDGIRVQQGSNIAIGAAAAGAGNLISGNSGDGISISGGDTVTVKGNKIGTTASGTAALANTQAGVNAGIAGITVGGTASGEGNRIAFNGDDGVQVPGLGGVRVQGNSIVSNGEAAGDLGIDLLANGVTSNDAPPDSDPGLQNFPVITAAEGQSNSLTVAGELHSAPSATFRVELFANAACDAAGHGEGDRPLDGFDVTTDANGDATFNRSISATFSQGEVITGTATSATGDTSEFSSCETIVAPAGPPSVSVADAPATEGSGNNASFVVTLDHASTQTVSVDYATADGTATAGSDYTAKSGTLTITPGNTQAIVTVPMLDDALDEPTETFSMTLSNAQNASIDDGAATGTISDDDPTPTLSIADATAPEGGTASFDVTLSAASAQTVTVDYATADGTATAGSDYSATSGTLTFAPGDTQKTVPVDLLGDSNSEAEETFQVQLSGAANAGISDGTGDGHIQNVNQPPAASVDDAQFTEAAPCSPGSTNQWTDHFVSLNLNKPAPGNVDLTYSLLNGSAQKGSDFLDISSTHTVHFSAGQQSRTAKVPIRCDLLTEGDETFAVKLTGANNATIADDEATITIKDNPPQAASVDDAQFTEAAPCSSTSASSWTDHFVWVHLDKSAKTNIDLTYSLLNGSAQKSSDYLDYSSTHTVHFGVGQQYRTVKVPIRCDLLTEGDETFKVKLTGANNATIADDEATITIKDNPPPPPPHFGPETRITFGGGATAVVTPTGTASVAVVNSNPFTVKGKLGLTVGAPAGGASAARRLMVGRKAFKLRSNKRNVVRVKLTQKGRRLLRARGRMRVGATLTLTDPAGHHRKLTRELTLRWRS